MQLSTKGRYAVMAMADLAKNSFADDSPMNLAQIADRQNISLSYLEQLFVKLRRAGLVESVRGPGGGYKLARKAKNILISNIMSAVDEPVQITRCTDAPDEPGCVGGEKCLTHGLWAALGQHLMSFLKNVTLEDVINGSFDVEYSSTSEKEEVLM